MGDELGIDLDPDSLLAAMQVVWTQLAHSCKGNGSLPVCSVATSHVRLGLTGREAAVNGVSALAYELQSRTGGMGAGASCVGGAWLPDDAVTFTSPVMLVLSI